MVLSLKNKIISDYFLRKLSNNMRFHTTLLHKVAILFATVYALENEIDFENKTVAEVLAQYNISLEQLFDVEEDMSPEVFDPTIIFDPPVNKTVTKENEKIKDLVDLVSPNIQTVMSSLLNRTKRYVNPKFSPCESFYYFACGNYIRSFDQRKDSFHPMWLVSLRTKLVAVLRNLLEDVKEDELKANGTDREVIDFEMKAKRFYGSCMDEVTLNERGAKPLLDIFDSYGGWPLLNPNWNQDQFDWLNLTAEMYHKYDVIVWHSIYFQQGSNTMNKVLSLSGYNKTQMQLYIEYVHHMLQLFGVSPDNATLAAKEIVDFEMEVERVKVLFKRSYHLENETKQMTVAELYRNIGGIDWFRYLEILTGEKPRLTDKVNLFPISYFQRLSHLVTTADPRTIANYMFWTFAQKYTNYLGKRFYYPKNSLLDSLDPKLKILETPRWKQCLMMLPQSMREGFVTIYLRKYYDNIFDEDILPIAADVQDAFKSMFSEKTWIDDNTKFLGKMKLEKVQIKPDYLDMFPVAPINEKFKELNISYDKFFENILEIDRFMRKPPKKKENSDGPIQISWSVSFYMEDMMSNSSPTYDIRLPVTILRSPFYHYYFPEFVKYAGVGALVGTILSDSFRRGENQYPEFSIKLGSHWWSNSSLSEYKDRLTCFRNQYTDIRLCNKNLSDDAFIQEVVSNIGGLRASYRAYAKWLEDNKANLDTFRPETYLDVNMTRSQLFFLSYAQTMCGGNRMYTDMEIEDYCDTELRMFEIFSKTPEFAEAFECPLGSPMNPFDKCSLW